MNSTWFKLAGALGAQVQAVAAEQSASYLGNPALPLDTAGRGERLLFVLQRGDRVLDQPGQRREKRRFRVVVGALALTRTPLADADALLFAARSAMRSEACRAALKAAGDAAGPLREVEAEPELKDLAAEGSVLLTAIEVDYFETYPDAA